MVTFTALTTVRDAAAADALADALEGLAPAPVALAVIEVEDGSGVFEVGAYFEGPPDDIALALLAAAHGARPFAISRVEDRDWVAQVRRELHPVEAGRFVVHGGHDADRVPPNRVALRIEAAMAFGTGHHASTRGCLLLFDRMLRRGLRPRRVADIGCGTGVLAMAAARALRVPCVATDIDPVAVATARENAGLNALAPWVRCAVGPGTRAAELRRAAPFDLVFANILAAPLRRLAPEVARVLAPGGRVILAGILARQVAGVLGVYRGHGFRVEDRLRLGEWVSLALRREGGRKR